LSTHTTTALPGNWFAAEMNNDKSSYCSSAGVKKEAGKRYLWNICQ